MEKITLKQLYERLNPTEQANFLRFFAAKLFVKPSTAIQYLQGYRHVPVNKQGAISLYASRAHGVHLNFQ